MFNDADEMPKLSIYLIKKVIYRYCYRCPKSGIINVCSTDYKPIYNLVIYTHIINKSKSTLG